MKKVIITSKNPVKIESVKLAFAKMFSEQDFEYEAVSVSSGVSDQPIDDEQTRLGAKNRIKNAEKIVSGDFYVGLEGGINDLDHDMESFAWMYIKSGEKIGKARTATFFLPQKVGELIRGGMELGDADDVVFGQSNSKQANGAVGLLTGDVITRSSYYTEALCMALIPFKNPELY
jgi:inosine/xanthosine triphosphatase